MHILVMHRVPDSFARYAESIDHTRHEVTYVSAKDRVATWPREVPARRLERPGTGDTAAEVLEAVAGLPAPDMVIALSEYDLIPAARVREALGVPGPRVRDVLPVRDKVVMKSAVAKADLRIPAYAPLDAALAADAGPLPWEGRTLLKPLARASAEGVLEFPAARMALDRARADASVDARDYEIEEFVEGPIFHVDGLVEHGALVAVQASRYVGTALGYANGLPLGSVQTDTPPSITDWTLRCLRAVGIDNGPFHLEGIETGEGPVFMEVGARFGGADVVDSFELATGMHLPSAQVRQLVAGSAGALPRRSPDPGQRYGWFVVPGHTLGSRYCRISGERRFREAPAVWRWVQRAPDEPVKDVITYADTDVPLAGVIGPASTGVLDRFLSDMFAAVHVEAASRHS